MTGIHYSCPRRRVIMMDNVDMLVCKTHNARSKPKIYVSISFCNRAFGGLWLREVPCHGPGSFVLRDYNHRSEGLLVRLFRSGYLHSTTPKGKYVIYWWWEGWGGGGGKGRGGGWSSMKFWSNGGGSMGHAFRYRKHKLCKISNAFSAIERAHISKFPGGACPRTSLDSECFHVHVNPFTPKFKKYILPTFLKRNV